MSRASTQRIITLALKVLDDAAGMSRREAVQTIEVRLALSVLWMVLRDRRGLLLYWERAAHFEPKAWETCREPYGQIEQALRREGWGTSSDGVTVI